MWRGRHGGLDKKICSKWSLLGPDIFFSRTVYYFYRDFIRQIDMDARMFLEYFDNMPNIDEDGP